MLTVNRLICQFMEESSSCLAVEELNRLYSYYLGFLGIECFVFSLMTDHPSIGMKAGHGVTRNYPDEWMRYYQDRNYAEIDPVRKRITNGGAPFAWNSLEDGMGLKQLHMMNEAAEAGLQQGVGIALPNSSFEIAGVGLATNLKDPYISSAENVARLRVLSEQYNARYFEMQRQEMPLPKLSPRQKEILQWAAVGKTNEEIASILNLEVKTVEFHMRNILTTLGSVNRIQAVVKGITLRLIEVPDLF